MESQNQKRILYVITKSNFGGAQRYVFELAEAMQAAGHCVAVASAPSGLLVEKLKSANITHCPIHSFQRDISIKKEIGALGELKTCYQDFVPDLIHLNSSKAGLLGAIAGRRLRRRPKLIFTAHGWPFLEPRPILWRTMAWAGSWLTGLLSDKVILVSDNDHLKTNLPLVKKKCQVIKTAVSNINFYNKVTARDKLFTQNQINDHKTDIWLGTIAELHRNKNLSLAIKAVAKHNQSHEQKIYYSIIGDGELKNELVDLIRDIGAEYYINLLGYINNAREYLKAFDVFLLPSKKEGLPYTILEAGSAGIPVIASRVGGVPEVITHQQNGLLFNNDNQTDLNQALTTYTDQPLREQQAIALKNTINTEFTLTKMVSATAAVYSSMIDNSVIL